MEGSTLLLVSLYTWSSLLVTAATYQNVFSPSSPIYYIPSNNNISWSLLKQYAFAWVLFSFPLCQNTDSWLQPGMTRDITLRQYFSVRDSLLSRGHLGISRDTFGCHNWGMIGSWHLVGRPEGAKHPPRHRMAPHFPCPICQYHPG